MYILMCCFSAYFTRKFLFTRILTAVLTLLTVIFFFQSNNEIDSKESMPKQTKAEKEAERVKALSHNFLYRGALQGTLTQKDLTRLLKQGADLEYKCIDQRDQTSLWIACAVGHTRIVKMLLASGARVEARNADGGTCLVVAAQVGHVDVVAALLDAGADIEWPSAAAAGGKMALCVAASGGHTAVVKLLLKKDARIDAREADGSTPLSTAAFHGHLPCINALLSNNPPANVNSQCNVHATALWTTCNRGHTACAEALLKAGADTNLVNVDTFTPLQAAACYGRTGCVKALLMHGGSNIDAVNQQGR
jgi:ankyrin repeat protein